MFKHGAVDPVVIRAMHMIQYHSLDFSARRTDAVRMIRGSGGRIVDWYEPCAMYGQQPPGRQVLDQKATFHDI
jgi:hypothetical protein